MFYYASHKGASWWNQPLQQAFTWCYHVCYNLQTPEGTSTPRANREHLPSDAPRPSPCPIPPLAPPSLSPLSSKEFALPHNPFMTSKTKSCSSYAPYVVRQGHLRMSSFKLADLYSTIQASSRISLNSELPRREKACAANVSLASCSWLAALLLRFKLEMWVGMLGNPFWDPKPHMQGKNWNKNMAETCRSSLFRSNLGFFFATLLLICLPCLWRVGVSGNERALLSCKVSSFNALFHMHFSVGILCWDT